MASRLQAAPTAMPAISSGHSFPSSFPRFPPRRPPPHPSFSVGRGRGLARRLSRKKRPAADGLQRTSVPALSPGGSTRVTLGRSGGQSKRGCSLAPMPPLGSAICWDLAHRRVQQSLTLGDHSSWTHSARALGGGAERSFLRGKSRRTWGCRLPLLGQGRAERMEGFGPAPSQEEPDTGKWFGACALESERCGFKS